MLDIIVSVIVLVRKGYILFLCRMYWLKLVSMVLFNYTGGGKVEFFLCLEEKEI